MLVFVDESGDPGLKLEQGSSTHFVVALVIFEDHDEAQAADDRIGLLRRELRLDPRYEFRFNKCRRGGSRTVPQGSGTVRLLLLWDSDQQGPSEALGRGIQIQGAVLQVCKRAGVRERQGGAGQRHGHYRREQQQGLPDAASDLPEAADQRAGPAVHQEPEGPGLSEEQPRPAC